MDWKRLSLGIVTGVVIYVGVKYAKKAYNAIVKEGEVVQPIQPIQSPPVAPTVVPTQTAETEEISQVKVDYPKSGPMVVDDVVIDDVTGHGSFMLDALLKEEQKTVDTLCEVEEPEDLEEAEDLESLPDMDPQVAEMLADPNTTVGDLTRIIQGLEEVEPLNSKSPGNKGDSSESAKEAETKAIQTSTGTTCVGPLTKITPLIVEGENKTSTIAESPGETKTGCDVVETETTESELAKCALGDTSTLRQTIEELCPELANAKANAKPESKQEPKHTEPPKKNNRSERRNNRQHLQVAK